MSSDWPEYERETQENLDVSVTNYGTEVDMSQVEVQVVGFPNRPVSGAWQAHPYRISSLPIGKYDAYTRWSTPDGQKVVDHVGPTGQPSFQIR